MRLLIACLALLTPGPVMASFATATAEITLVIDVTADPGVGVEWFSLPVGTTGPCCYGLHAESGGGDAGADEDGDYRVGLFSTAYVQGPPPGLSRNDTLVFPGLIGTFTNSTSGNAVVMLDLFGEIALEAAAYQGRAEAFGRYAIRGGAGTDAYVFADSFRLGPTLISAKPNTAVRQIVLAPNERYELYLDSAVTRAFAAVPEPGQWLMLIVGFSMTGATVRRRNLRSSRSATFELPSNGHGVVRASDPAFSESAAAGASGQLPPDSGSGTRWIKDSNGGENHHPVVFSHACFPTPGFRNDSANCSSHLSGSSLSRGKSWGSTQGRLALNGSPAD